MNLELLDPFRNNFPEVIEDRLEEGFVTTCCFNRRGTLLATGCHDGRCIIWDFDTRGIAKVLTGHIHPVTSVSWSRNGRKLLSSSTDWNVHLTDVLTGNIDQTIEFESPVHNAQMHPRNNAFCLACPHMDSPVLVNLTTGEKKKLNVDTEDDKGSENIKTKTPKYDIAVVAVFDKQGEKIFTGSSRGVITILDMQINTLYSFKVPGAAPIKSIVFSRSGEQFMVNSTDKIIRLYEGENSTVVAREFQDPVNRMQWKKCYFSCDGEYIIGGSAQKSQHNIYIWHREAGQLIKTLEGPKEGIMDLVWHPARPIIVSISTSGIVYIWASNYQENWSAFAPDFKELEENEEYKEREDEFDIIDEEETGKKKLRDESADVDIITVDKLSYFSSDEEDDLYFVPTTIEPLQEQYM